MRSAAVPATLAAVWSLVPGALAQPTFDGRVAFRADHLNDTAPTIANGGEYLFDPAGLAAPQTIQFALMLGVFNAQGYDNRGMYSWAGDLTGVGAGFTLGNAPGRRAPFTFTPGGNGVVAPGGEAVTGIDAVRNPLVRVPWQKGEPPLEPDTFQGRDAYFSTFRFTLTLTDPSERSIDLSTAGIMYAIGGVIQVGEPESGFTDWVLIPLDPAPAAGGFRLTIIPAPGAAALLGLGALLAAHRRR